MTADTRTWLAAALAAPLMVACGAGDPADTDGNPLAGGDVAAGRDLFDANCAACHGLDAVGSSHGPPLVHQVYEPSHHGDAAFLLAVQRGVVPHHWDFGPMPAIPTLGIDDVTDIVAYVRSLQRDAGIR